MASFAVVPRFEAYAAIASGLAWGGFWEAGDKSAEDFAGSPFAAEGRVAHGEKRGKGRVCRKAAFSLCELEDCRGASAEQLNDEMWSTRYRGEEGRSFICQRTYE